MVVCDAAALSAASWPITRCLLPWPRLLPPLPHTDLDDDDDDEAVLDMLESMGISFTTSDAADSDEEANDKELNAELKRLRDNLHQKVEPGSSFTTLEVG